MVEAMPAAAVLQESFQDRVAACLKRDGADALAAKQEGPKVQELKQPIVKGGMAMYVSCS